MSVQTRVHAHTHLVLWQQVAQCPIHHWNGSETKGLLLVTLETEREWHEEQQVKDCSEL